MTVNGDHVDVNPAVLGLPFTDVSADDVLLVANGDNRALGVEFGCPRHHSETGAGESGFNAWIVTIRDVSTGAAVRKTGQMRLNWVYIRKP